jgi:hypothetical protein
VRHLALLALLTSANAVADIVASSPYEKPTSVTSTSTDLIVHLGKNSIVRFYLAGEQAVAVEMSVAGYRSVFQLDTCALPRDIHVDGMELERGDIREGDRAPGALTLYFFVGTEKDRRFGELPRAQLTWARDRLMAAVVHKKVGANEGTTLPLCFPDVQPNTSLERTRER